MPSISSLWREPLEGGNVQKQTISEPPNHGITWVSIATHSCHLFNDIFMPFRLDHPFQYLVNVNITMMFRSIRFRWRRRCRINPRFLGIHIIINLFLSTTSTFKKMFVEVITLMVSSFNFFWWYLNTTARTLKLIKMMIVITNWVGRGKCCGIYVYWYGLYVASDTSAPKIFVHLFVYCN